MLVGLHVVNQEGYQSYRNDLSSINLGLIVSADFPGLVVWPSSAADTGEKARIVRAQRVCALPVSANRTGDPKGHATANMVLATFAETKVARLPGSITAFLNHSIGGIVCPNITEFIWEILRASSSCVTSIF